jgi:hypothetical protein
MSRHFQRLILFYCLGEVLGNGEGVCLLGRMNSESRMEIFR